jgi:hypothetical protein
MRFEHYSEELLPFRKWVRRVGLSLGMAAIVGAISLSIGVVGYHTLGNLSWVDALLEASMIMGGEGPIAPMTNHAVKLFASAYALFSGLVLLTTMGLLIAPWLHRFLHHMHKEFKGK